MESLAMLMVMAMLGVGMLPLIFMPSWLRPFSHISPVKWSILALEGAVW
jgi:ABC-2 type transport system permease protein